MTEHPTTQADTAADDWLEALLREDGREHRAEYVEDDGFTARVMAALPAPATLPAWRKPVIAGLWAIAGLGIALSLPSAVYEATHEVLRIVLAQRVSLTGIVAGVAALGVATWVSAALALREK